MPSFKITIPSSRTESGQEITRWNVNKPIEQVTFDLLVKRLRQLIDTPTSGYIVTWSDAGKTHNVQTTEELHEAIEYFAEKKYADKCVRLKAEPKDVLDFRAALEMLAAENSNEQQSAVHEQSENAISNDKVDQTSGRSKIEDKNQKKPEKPSPMKGFTIQSVVSINIKPEPPFEEESLRQKSTTPAPGVSEPSVSVPTRSTPIQITPSAASAQPNRSIPAERSPLTGSPNIQQSLQASNDSRTESQGKTKLSREQVYALSRQLYMMGFQFSEDKLKRTIRKYNGDINLIVDKLTAEKP